MAEYSIIEFLVYAMVGYSGVLGLILTAWKERKVADQELGWRAVWLVLSVICLGVLASVDVVHYDTSIITNTITSNATSEVWTESITHQGTIPFEHPIWIPINILFFIILIVYIIMQLLTTFQASKNRVK